jgi:hypothetical protein
MRLSPRKVSFAAGRILKLTLVVRYVEQFADVLEFQSGSSGISPVSVAGS